MRRLLVVLAITNAGCGELAGIEEKEYVESGGIRALSALNCTTCAVLEKDGSVWCWGANEFGQLGGEKGVSDGTPKPIELDPSVEVKAKDVSVGTLHACAISEEGDVYCWGSNAAGQADGKPPTIDCSADRAAEVTNLLFSSVSPTKIELDLPAVEVAAGALHTCARTSDTSVYCWGLNHAGQCGRASNFKPTPEAGKCGFDFQTIGDALCTSHEAVVGAPQRVELVSNVEQLVVQRNTSCARTGAAVRCWGGNCGDDLPLLGNDCAEGGQLGVPPSTLCFQDTPELVPGLSNHTPNFVSLGHLSGYAIKTPSNEVYSWGWNDGQLGYPATESFSSPAPVRQDGGGNLEEVSLKQIKRVARTNGWHQLAQAADGTVFSWGDNHRGELGQKGLPPGDESNSPEAAVADRIPSAPGLLASGQDHTCYELDGEVYCFGHAAYVGQQVDGMGTCDTESAGASVLERVKVVFE